MANASIDSLSFKVTADVSRSAKKNLMELASALTTLSNAASGVDTSKFEALASALGDISRSAQSMKGASGLANLARTLNALGRATNSVNDESITAVTDGIAQLTDGLRNMNLDGLEKFQEFAQSVGQLSGLNDFTNAMTRLGNLDLSKLKSLNYVAPQIRMMARAINDLTEDHITKIERLAEALATLGKAKVKIKIDGVGSAQAQNPTDVDDSATEATDESVSAFTRLRESVKGASSEVAKLVAKMGSLFKVKPIAGFFANQFKKTFIAPLQEGTKAVHGFLSSIGRILMYRAIRGLISSLTGAIGEGIKNLYHYSSLMGTTFAGSMDSLSASMQYLKNSMGAMASPLINALAPAIDYIIDKLVALMNVFNQVMARLTGAGFYTRAVKVAKAFDAGASKASGGAKKAAAELKKTILSFDEINKLNDQNSGGSGGGGGGAGGADYGDMFETVPIESSISDFADRLKKAFNDADWQSLGVLLGDKVNEGMNAISWSNVGEKIGKGLDGAFKTAYYFLDTIDFKAFGMHVADLLSNVFENTDFTYVGRLFIKKLTILPDMAIGFIHNMDWYSVGDAIGGFLEGAILEAGEWLKSVDFGQVVFDVVDAIGGVLSGALSHLPGKFGEFSDSISKLIGNVWDSAKRNLTGFGDALVAGFAYIVDNFHPIEWLKDAFTGGNSFSEFSDGLSNAIEEAFNSNRNLDLSVNVTATVTNFRNKCKELKNPEAAAKYLSLSELYAIVNEVSKNGKIDKEYLAELVGADNVTAIITEAYKAGFVDDTATLMKSNYTAVINGAKKNSNVRDTSSLMGGNFTAVVNNSSIGSSVKKAPALMTSSFPATVTSSSIKSGVSKTPALMNNEFNAKVIGASIAQKAKDQLAEGAKVTATVNHFVISSTARKELYDSSLSVNAAHRAIGGVFSNGAWQNIPQFASGGVPGNHGSLFLAGEAGSELVGHVGGRTEVLNRSQLASTMYASVADGMLTAMSMLNRGDNTDMTKSVYDGVSMAMQRQIDMLREQIDLLRELTTKDYRTEVTASGIHRANVRKSIRDGRTVGAY